jgi:succinate dehydrogenase / fumarate reductase membrane anchor subunit
MAIMSTSANKDTPLQTPLGRVRGLGSAKSGAHHWIYQRLTAVLLIPLMLCLVATLVTLPSLEHGEAAAYAAQPLVALTLFFTMAAMLYHAKLGLTVVIEDYVHCACVRIGMLVAVKILAVIAISAVSLALIKLVIAG